MKKFNVFFILFALLVIGLSCKRKDQTPPKIFITGDSIQRVIVESYYKDKGATADDNFDGAEIGSRISIVYDIAGLPSGITDWKNLEGWTNKTGEYTVTYSVTDDAGFTTSKDRKVEVYNQADKFAVDYYAKKTSANPISPMTSDYSGISMSVTTDSKKNNRMLLPKLSKISGLKIYGDIRDSVIWTGTDSIIRKYIHIPAQGKTGTMDNGNTYYFDVQGVPGQSYFIDTLFFYKFRVSYNIDRYESEGGNWMNSDDAVEVYEKI